MGKETAKVISHKAYIFTLDSYIFVVGDFGLATSSLAAVDPSDVSPVLVTPDSDMTLGKLHLVFP